VLDVDLEVVLQVLPDAGKVLHHFGTQGLELAGIAHARELQELEAN